MAATPKSIPPAPAVPLECPRLQLTFHISSRMNNNPLDLNAVNPYYSQNLCLQICLFAKTPLQLQSQYSQCFQSFAAMWRAVKTLSHWTCTSQLRSNMAALRLRFSSHDVNKHPFVICLMPHFFMFVLFAGNFAF